MVRIAWRDLAGRAPLTEVLADLSALAEACVDLALEQLYLLMCEQFGTPLGEGGEAQRLVVLGMGKLGGGELNFSSDIDLIFAYPEEGETQGGRRPLSNQEFFIRLGQRLCNLLSQNTAHGFVFRVDMRLRPFGEASALALSFDAMENYYQTHGREWERYAMLKARVVAGDRVAGEALLALLKPFVYRRYVDYGAFESLREMKALIDQEVRRKEMAGNVKLGPGGIREIEFIGQAFQLIRGGREPKLQTRSILTALAVVQGFGWLPDYVVQELTAAYDFLRRTEHRIQAWSDQQSHELPTDDEGRWRLALAMGFTDWPSFERALQRHMGRVQSHFAQVFAAPQTEHEASDPLDLAGIWRGTQEDEVALAALQRAGYSRPEWVMERLSALRAAHVYRALSSVGRGRMDRLMPLLLGAVGQAEAPDTTLERVLRLIETITRRTAYLALLVENPVALSQLVRLCAASTFIANLLSHAPLLLDELLDARILYTPPGRAALEAELDGRLANIDGGDVEQQMETLRRFKQAGVLRVAAADVMEAMPLMVVSDHLTDIAEVVLSRTLDTALDYLTIRHGRPAIPSGGSGFAVVAYGKLGGIELGYGSDLDLVFLRSADEGGSDGLKSLDNAVYHARLAQRMIHILTTRTALGDLYEIDMRLRPSGASGLLVTGLPAFSTYQENDAWTWEHQALVRARVVCGDPQVAAEFAAVRRRILTRRREQEVLRGEVRQMRERMREQLSKAQPGQFDLKQDRGGIADIEFMVQYGVLAWACDHPELLQHTDNIHILAGFAANGLMAATEAEGLADAYRNYRAAVHRRSLQEQEAVVPEATFAAERERVMAAWQRLMEE